ncbi:hypothetical protein CGGC5_v001958 [Colletotrichum fructicola Nara gc5]|uniref:Uncharacterized protein n=1 Tax=Colletotrichum fructicola (strain Nara gc5) TaxID=1213859 RepID=A0A7J6JNK9_COLFN|nr:hypothetical protein CGGC5_v001958 [Colletotrichum fructicola Nara gc5]
MLFVSLSTTKCPYERRASHDPRLYTQHQGCVVLFVRSKPLQVIEQATMDVVRVYFVKLWGRFGAVIDRGRLEFDRSYRASSPLRRIEAGEGRTHGNAIERTSHRAG